MSTICLKKAIDQYIQDTIQVCQIWHNLCSERTSMWTFKMYSRWKESFIFRYFKIFQVFQMFTCGLSDLLLLAVDSLIGFVLREYILKVHILIRSEHKLCQIWNTCIVSCIYWSIAFFKQIVDIFFNKTYLEIDDTGR
jgi:uncharacterized membrane protein